MAWRYYDVKFIDGYYYYRPTFTAYHDIQEALKQGQEGVLMPNTPTYKYTDYDGIKLYECMSKQYEVSNMFGVKEEKEESDRLECLIRECNHLMSEIRREIDRTKS